MTRVSLATCADFPDGDEDAPALIDALARIGVEARLVAWDDPAARPGDDLMVLRSTWNYTLRRADFREWVDSLPRVENPLPIVHWNTDKVYLRDLDAAGVPIVPTAFAAPGEQVELPAAGEFVVKPSVGAGSRGAGRFTAGRADAARGHAAALHEDGRVVLVQPYLAEVDSAGETALIYFDGRFSHAIRKAALLGPDYAHPLTGDSLYIEESIAAREPSPAELQVGKQSLAFVRERFGADPLYARVDLLQSPDGPVVIELELTEPSLFLGFADGAADRFAAAIAARA